MDKKSFEDYTLEEILYLNDKNLYNRYINELANFSTNRISRAIISEMQGKSLSAIYQEIINQEESCRSLDFFNGDLVLLYGGIKERIARNFITCDFSGAIIYPKRRYISYRPILDNISANEVYVLKRTLKVECGYEYDLPSNIQQLEELQRNIHLQNDINDGIDYSHLSTQIGGELILTPLRNKIKRKSK